MPWRSLLFVPSHVERFVTQAHRRGADAIILDLEDAVPAGSEARARAALPDAIRSVEPLGGAAMVRVNHGLLELARDLEAAVVPRLAALVLPKVEAAAFELDGRMVDAPVVRRAVEILALGGPREVANVGARPDGEGRPAPVASTSPAAGRGAP